MSVVAIKSSVITNRDATPRVLNNSSRAEGRIHEFVGNCTITSGDSIGSTYNFGSIPSNARMSSIKLWCPDLGTTTVTDIGLYKATSEGGTVQDADFFIAATSLKDGAVAALDVTHSNVITLTNGEKMIWELLGLTADPGVYYDVVATLTAAADGTGVALMKGQFVI
jgi:hypothetical protein